VESVIPKAVLIDIQRFASSGLKTNLAASEKLPVTSFMKQLQKQTKHIHQKRKKSLVYVLDAKVTGQTAKHVIRDHIVYFCLNCDNWVKDKTKVLDNNWTMFDGSGNLRYDV
jgi:hypothetical protein